MDCRCGASMVSDNLLPVEPRLLECLCLGFLPNQPPPGPGAVSSDRGPAAPRGVGRPGEAHGLRHGQRRPDDGGLHGCGVSHGVHEGLCLADAWA